MPDMRTTTIVSDDGPPYPRLRLDDCTDAFPLLARTVKGHRLVYLDSAASSQKPTAVLDAMTRYYRTSHANVHRGIYTLAEEATALYEGARSKIAHFLGSAHERDIVFTNTLTYSINLVSNAWGRANLQPHDVVLLTQMEH